MSVDTIKGQLTEPPFSVPPTSLPRPRHSADNQGVTRSFSQNGALVKKQGPAPTRQRTDVGDREQDLGGRRGRVPSDPERRRAVGSLRGRARRRPAAHALPSRATRPPGSRRDQPQPPAAARARQHIDVERAALTSTRRSPRSTGSQPPPRAVGHHPRSPAAVRRQHAVVAYKLIRGRGISTASVSSSVSGSKSSWRVPSRPRPLQRVVKVLRQSLDRAVGKGWLPDNPARKVDLLREDKPEIDPFSLAEAKTVHLRGSHALVTRWLL
jgi:hypothetical protein